MPEDGEGNSAPDRLPAAAAAAAIGRGEITAEALVAACLDRIETRDALVCAWAHVDAEGALAAARRADAARDAGEELGPLHGVPVGIKDIFDTADMPTECGSALYLGRQPGEDAAAVAALRRAGAIVIGKTVTTEFALSAPGPTTNPLDPRRTPGGSSSGSAAAVADRMVPLAVGSQTTGSVIRPASYCGIVGFKPTFGAISRDGMHILSERLDHVGVFARTLEDIALMARTLMPRAFRGERAIQTPRIGVVRAPVWSEASEDARSRFDSWAASIGMEDTVELGPVFEDAVACQKTILDASLAERFGPVRAERPEALREITRDRIASGLALGEGALAEALARAEEQRAHLDGIFEAYDALLTLAAPGEAPLGLSSTGNAVFSAIWTLMGAPCVTLPLLEGENGMPIGVQLIGAPGADERLLATAAAFEARSTERGARP